MVSPGFATRSLVNISEITPGRTSDRFIHYINAISILNPVLTISKGMPKSSTS